MVTTARRDNMIARISDERAGRARLVVRMENGIVLKSKLFPNRRAAVMEWANMYR